MTTWGDLAAFVRWGYEVVKDTPEEIRILIHFGGDIDEDGRSQLMVISREALDDGAEWVQIATPVSQTDQTDVTALLTEIGNSLVVGGLVIMGDYLVLRHTLPLADLDPNEFHDPLQLLAIAADGLEIQFVGQDVY